jgi:hypothetical protein
MNNRSIAAEWSGVAPGLKSYSAILKKYKIAARFHVAFAEFVESGEVISGDRAFLDLFEKDAACQQAVEKAFALRIGNLRAALRAVKDL